MMLLSVRRRYLLHGPNARSGSKEKKQEIPFQGVYRLDDKGKVRLHTKDLSQPNGLAFSPDGKRFYVDDSEQKNIRVYSVCPGWKSFQMDVFLAKSLELRMTVYRMVSRSIRAATFL